MHSIRKELFATVAHLSCAPRALPVAVSGRFIAHAALSAAQRAFLVTDLEDGHRELIKPTRSQLAQQVHASLPYVRLAKRVKANPELRARVERGELSLEAAVKLLPPVRKPAPKPVTAEISSEAFVQLFAAVGPTVRAACVRSFPQEALDVIDSETGPAPTTRSSSPDAHVHLAGQ